MQYIYFMFEEEAFYIELDAEQIALRQVICAQDKLPLVSCRTDCLAEGTICLEEIEGVYETLSQEAFEAVWTASTLEERKKWETTKEAFPIGKEVRAVIRYFYPQGIIVDLDGQMGCVHYETDQDKLGNSARYPGQQMYGRVAGYDETNMWILLDA